MDRGHQFFADKYGLTDRDLERYLGEALSAGGDYADLYFEYQATTSIGLDESMVKGATQGVSLGCGVRVMAGEQTGYAYTDDLAPGEDRAGGADCRAHRQRPGANASRCGLAAAAAAHNLYPVAARAYRHRAGAQDRTGDARRPGRPRLRRRASSRCASATPTRCATC